MILIQHADAQENHVSRVEEVSIGKHAVVMRRDLSDVPNLEQTEILFTFGKGFTPDTFRQMPNLKWIQLTSTGFDHMPKDYILEKGIQLTTVKGAHAEPIAEYALSCMLYFARKMDYFLELQRQRGWDRLNYTYELAGKTVVIFGTGNLGKAIAKRTCAFSMRTIGVNHSGAPSSGFDEVFAISEMESLLKSADYLILALPLTDDTFHLIGTEQLELLKQSAVVINIGRGELMDEDAVRLCLLAKKVRGIALDVFHQEPLPPDSPLWDVPGLLLTPHIAGKTDRFFDRSLDVFIENYKRYVKGEGLQNLANFNKGY